MCVERKFESLVLLGGDTFRCLWVLQSSDKEDRMRENDQWKYQRGRENDHHNSKEDGWDCDLICPFIFSSVDGEFEYFHGIIFIGQSS